MARFPRGPRVGADRAAGRPGTRAPHPHRVDLVAHAWRAVAGASVALSVCALAPVGSRQPRERARGCPPGIRRVRRRAAAPRSSRRHSRARRRFSRRRGRQPGIHARLLRPAPAGAGGAHEPAVRARKHAHLDRRTSRPPVAAAPERGRNGRAADRGGRRRRGRRRGWAAAVWSCRRARPGLDRGCRQRSPGAQGHEPRGRGRQPAAGGACPRPCDERCARQHRPQHRVHESRRSRAGRTGSSPFASSHAI